MHTKTHIKLFESTFAQYMVKYTKQAKSGTHFMFAYFKTKLNINEVCYGQTNRAHEK